MNAEDREVRRDRYPYAKWRNRRGKGSIFNRFVRYSIWMIAIPSLLFTLAVLVQYRQEYLAIEEKRAADYLTEMREGISRNMDTMRASARSVLADSVLQRTVNLLTVSQSDLLQLKRRTVANIQNVRSVNEELSILRFYFARDDLVEIASSVYPICALPEAVVDAVHASGPIWRIGHGGGDSDAKSLQQYVLLYMPVYTLDGEFGGLVETGMSLSSFLSDMSVVKSNMLVGFMTDGNIMYYSYSNREYAFGEQEWSYYLQDLRGMFMRGKSAFTDTLGDSGHVVYGRTEPLPQLDGMLFCVLDMDEQIWHSNRLILVCITAFALFILLAFLVTRVFTGRLLNRMYRLIYGMHEVEQGNLDVHMSLGRQDDEISELSLLFNNMIDALNMLNRVNEQRQLIAKRSDVRALSNQINAHFLYNTLETIRMMAYIGGDSSVAQAVAQLGSIFRYAMHTSDATVTVEEELENIRIYLQLMELQMDYKISLTLEVDPLIRRQEICRLSLQPLVENAVRHGLGPLGRDSGISIRAVETAGDAFELIVTDPGVGIGRDSIETIRDALETSDPSLFAEGRSIGLLNVHNRTRLHFGRMYGLRVESAPGEGTSVILRLPLRK